MTNIKIKVLELVDSFGYAGTQRTVINFCRNLDRRFFTVHAAAFSEGGPREKELREMEVPYVVAHNNASVVADLVCKEKIQVVHIHRSGQYNQFQFELLQASKKASPEIVIIETNVVGRFDPQAFPLIDCSLQVSQMMFNERYVKEAGHEDFTKMGVLHYPVDASTFERNPLTQAEIANFKDKIGVKKGDFVIGKMGRPHIAKWSDLLLDMMPYLVTIVPNVKFIIQAIPVSRRNVVLNSSYKDHVIMLDETSDDRQVALFYAALDVYVHASKIGEGFGMTLAEAGLFGKPVIVNSTPTRDNAQLEVIDHNQTGLIANYPQTFARAVAYLAQNPEIKQRLGRQARAKITSVYSPERITRMLEKIMITKLQAHGVEVSPETVAAYTSVHVWPNPSEITAFKAEYQKRLHEEFDQLTVYEKIVNMARVPRRFYRKLMDFWHDKRHPSL